MLNYTQSHAYIDTYIDTYIHTYLSGMNSFSQSFICVRILRSFLRMRLPAENGPVGAVSYPDRPGGYLVLVHSALVTAAAAHLSREMGIYVSSMVLEVFTHRIHIHVCTCMYVYMYV